MLSNSGSSPVKQRPSWLTWGYDTFLKTPVKWGINYMSSSQTESKDTKYIVIEVLHVSMFLKYRHLSVQILN